MFNSNATVLTFSPAIASNRSWSQKIWLTVIFLLLLFSGVTAQPKTSANSGNWNAAATWSPAGVPSAANAVTILAGHNVVVNVNTASLPSLTINAGGDLIVNDPFVVDAATITVNGTYTNGSTAGIVFTTMNVNAGGIYDHAIDGGTIPAATWAATSDCTITGIINTVPNGFAQSFGNLIWDSPGQLGTGGGGAKYLEADITVKGDFRVLDTNVSSVRMSNSGIAGLYTMNVLGDVLIAAAGDFKMNNGSRSCEMNVTGDLTVNSGSFTISTGPANSTLTVNGDVNILGAGGTLLMQEDGNAVTGFLIAKGDLTIGAGATIIETEVAGVGDITFNGGGIQTLTSAGTMTDQINVTVDLGSTLQIGNATTFVGGTGTFTLNAGTSLGITSVDGITTAGATGNIQVGGARTYDVGANYIYNGASNQDVGDGLPATVNSLTINNSGGGGNNTVSLGSGIAITGALNVSQGVFDIAGNNITSVGSVDMTGTSIVGSGILTLAGNVTTNSSATTASIGVPISLGVADRTFAVADNVAVAPDLNITGIISGANMVIKSGAGSMSLSGANNYSGGTTLSVGALNLNNSTAIGTGTFTISAGTIDNTSGGPITLSNNNVQNWNGDFSFGGSNELNLGTGAVTPSGNRQITALGSNLIVGGIIGGGAVSLTKLGVGTLTLSGVNTFSGGTTLTAGTLNVNNTNALGNVGGTFTINGGTIDNTSGGTITTVNYPLTWNGDFSFSGSNNLDLGNGNVSFGANRQVTVNGGSLTVGGIISAAAFDITKAGVGTLNFGTNPVTINALTISNGTLLSTAGNLTLSGSFSNSGTFTHNSGTVLYNGAATQNVASVNYNNLSFTGAGQKNASGNISVASNLNNASVFDMGAGTLSVTGTITNSGTIRFSGSTNGLALPDGTVEYYGGSQTITAGTYNNLDINQSSGEAGLGGDVNVNGTLSLLARNLNLNGSNLTIAAISVVGPSASKMIIDGGGGQVRKVFTVDGAFTFPIGDNSGTLEYSPITVNVSATAYGGGAYVAASVIDAKHPSNASTVDFLSRYWEITTSGITTPTVDVTGTYTVADLGGYTDTDVSAAQLDGVFNQSSNPWDKGAPPFGTLSVVTLSAANALLTDGQTSAFTGIRGANPSVSIDNGAAVSVCEGSTLALTTTAGGTPTILYSWSPATDLSSTIISNPVFTGNTPGGPYVYTVTVRDGNGIVAMDNISITVNPTPTLSSTLTPAAICSGTTFSYTPTSATVGATFAWSRALLAGIAEAANAGAGNISEVLTNTTTTPINVTYVVTTTANGCSNAGQNVVVTVNPTPVLSSTLSPANICSGTVFNYTATSATVGATFAWSRALIAGITEGASAGAGNVSETLTNTTGAPIAVTYVYITTANGCNNAPGQNVVVTVEPVPVVNDPADQVLCTGAATVAVNFTGTATSYSWVNDTPSIGLAASGTGNIASFTAINSGTAPVVATITITPSYNACVGATENFTITVNPTPTLSSTLTPAAICSGTTFSYTPTSATVGATFAWSRALLAGIAEAANAGAGNISEVLTNTTTTPINVTYVVTTTANGCSNAGQNVVVTVNPTPVLSSTLSPANICSGTVFNYTATSATVGATFAWSRALIAGITEGASAGAGNVSETLTNTTGAPIAVTYVYITTANGCNNAPGQNVVVTVEPVPVVNDPADQVLCTGAATVAVNFTGTATSYSWVNDTPSIGLAASGTGNIASFTAINSGTAPVVATITITPSYNACVGATENFTITVNPTPTLSSTLTPAAICSGTTFSYTPTSATVGATFAWSRALLAGIAEAANAGAGNISEVLTNTTTTPINVTYVVTTTANGCSNAGQNVVVTVNPTPVLSSTLSPANICSGTVFNYTATSATVGATFAWSRALIAGITEGASAGAGNVSETLTNTTGAPIAVTYVYITTANGCNNAPGQNVVVTVEPVPVVNDPADQVLCTGAATVAVNFTGTATSYSWVNDTPSIGLAASGTGNIASFTAINSGTAPVVATITITPSYNACVGATENFTITVNPTPTLSSTLTPAAICSGTTFSYTPTSATVGATFAWSRALLAGIAEAANAGAGNISEVLTNTTTTPINVTYVVTTTANGCSNAGQNVVVTVNPTPVLSSTLSPANICSGTVFNYTATSATVGATFAWSRALIAGITEGASAGAGNVSETLTNTTGAPIAVTYVYITTANGCNNAPGQNVVVTVEPVPVVNDPADQVLCTGAATVAVNFTGTATSYSWVNDTPSIGLAASGTGNIASFTAINSGTAPVVATITITPSYNACVGATENFTITVNPTPTLSSTLTPAAICSGTTFSYTPTSATVGATFAWSRALLAGIAEAANAGAGNISEVLTNTTTTPINVTYVVTTTANGCSNAGQNVVVTVNPTPVLSSTLSPANICSGTVFNYTATSATVGATFAWSRALIAGITEGASAGAGNVSETLTNTTGAPIAVTYVYITTANGCNNAPGQNVVVTVEPVPVVNDPADQVLCTGAATVAVNFTGTATSYSWVNDTPSIGLAASGTGNIASFTAINSGTAPVVATITITPSYNACVGATENFTITVNPTPTLSSTLTPAAICSGTTFSYTPTSATVGATFAWSRALLAGIAEAANAGAGNISEVLTNTTTTPINVTYVVTTTANGCSNAGQNVVVTVNPTPVLSSTLSPANICSGTVFNYTATSATVGATFAWSRALIAGITEGASAGAGNVSETLTNTTGAPIAVTYVYITTANGCNNAPGQNVVVTVEPVPVVNDPADQVLCTGAATVAVNFTGTATSYSWVNDTPSIGLAASGTGNIASFTAINSGTAPVVATITITPSYNACVGATENFTITVNPTPTLSSTLTPAAICSGTTFSYTPTSATVGATFAWSRALLAGIAEAANAGAGNISEVLTNTTTTPINVTYVVTTTANGCSNAGQNVVVTVNPTPVLSSTLSPANICSGTVFNYTATSATVGATFAWSRALIAGITEGASAGAGNVSETLTNTTGAPIAVTYVYITTANGCNNAPGQNVVVTVEPVPVVNDPADQVLCTGAATVAVNFTGTATSYSWVNDTPSIGLAASGTGNIASFTAINSGTAPVVATITITPSYNACVGATENFTITVNPTPTLSSTLTPAAICSGTTFSYTPTSATVGATFAWSRALLAGIAEAANAGAGNISEVLTNTTTTPINVTYVVTTTANGCSNAGQNVVVTVNPTPVLSSTLSPANICSGTVFNYTATSATVGATFAWSRALIAGITEGASAGAGNVSETLTNTTGAPIAVTYVYITTANGCNNAPGQNVVVTVEPVPVVNDPADQVLCTGAATVAVNFTGTATSYSWVNDTPSIGLAASGTGNIASFTAINSGTAPVVATITITPSYNACVGATENFTITVNPTPTLSSTLTPAAICSGTTFSYTPTSATVGATFAWSRALLAGIAEAANAGAGNISEVLTNTTTTPINVTYVVTTTANGCSNAGQNVVVTVNPTPVLSSTLSPANICSGTVFNYTATSATVGATFAWSRALIAGITEGASAGAGNVSETLTNTTGAPIAVTYVYITTANGCNNAPGQNVVVTVEPVPVVNDPADQVLCTGAATVAVNFTGTATSYSWVNDTPSIGLAASGTGNIASFTAINSGTAPVVATITITPSYNACVGATENFTITVNPTPTLSSTLTPAAICSGTTFSYTPTSATVGATFAWSRALLAGIAEAANAGAGNISEVLTNTTTTPINVTYVVTTTANGCSNAGQNVVVTVNPTPVLSSTLSPANICSGTVFNYTATSATVGATFAWSRALIAGITEGASAGAGNVSETLTNTTGAPIAVTYVYITTANGCNNAPGQNVVVTVEPVPVVNDPADQVLCTGAATVAVNFTGTATSYSWVNDTPSIGLAASGTGNIASFTAINSGTAPVVATITITPSYNACVGATENFTITVNPTPTLSSTLTPAAICSGTTFSYTPTSATVGATFAWSRALLAGIAEAANAGAGNISEVLTNTTTTPINVTYVVTTTANGCSNAGQNVVVTVNPTPVLSSTLSPANICSGTVFNYTATSATVGATFAWSRALIAGITEGASAGAGNVSETLTNTTGAPIAVTYVYITTANGCNNAPGQNVVVTVEPVPVVNDPADQVLCTGAATVAVNFTGTATSYSWVNDTPSIGLAASGTGNIASFTAINSGTAPVVATITITPSYNACVGATENFTITVNPTPTLSSTLTPAAICSGTTFSYTPTSATVGATFAWSRALLAGIAEAANAGAGNISEVLTNTTTTPINVTYVVTTTANGCSNAGQNVVVTVNPTPVLSSTLSPANICSGTVFNYTATSATVGATFAWSRALIAGITEGASAGAGNVSETLTNTTGAPIAVTYVYITTANGCNNAPGQNVVVTVEPVPVVNDPADQVLCTGAATVAVNFTGTATSYSWVNDTPSIGLAASGTGNIASFTAINSGTAPVVATITITPSYNACVGATENFTITVNPTPTLSSTLTPAAICSGTTFSYTPTSATVGATFAWSRALLAGIAEAANAGAGNISEVLTNTTTTPINVTYVVTTTANGCSNAGQNVVVTVNPTPVLSSTLSPANICSGTVFNYTATSATVGATFAWSRALIAGITEGASAGAGNVSETLTNTTGAPIAVTYVYITTANGCNNAPGQNVVVTVEPVPVVNDPADQVLCTGAATVAVNFTGTATSYSWVNDTPSIGLAASGTGNIASFTAINSGTAPVVATITITPSYNACVGATENFTITVNPTPTLSSTLTPAAICSGTTFSYTPTSATVGATFAWSRALLAGIAEAANAGAGNISEVLTNTTTTPINVTYVVTTTANGCSNAGQNVVVTVNPTPVLSSTLSPANICSGTVFNYTATSATVGATFAWSRALIAGITEGASAGAGNVSETLTNTTGAPIAVTYVYITTANGCNNAPGQNVVVTVEPVPVVNDPADQVLCTGAATVAVNFTGTATSYSWVNDTPSIGLAASGTGNIASFTAINSGTAPVVATITITPSYNACVGATENFTITVNPTPTLSSTLTPAAICSGTTFSYTPTSATVGATFAWSRALLAGIAEAANAGAGNISEVLTNTTTTPINVTYVVTTTANGCSNAGQNVVVTVNPTPVLSSTLSPANICSGTVFNYTATSATVGATFAWSRALIAGITEGASAGAGNVSETLTNTTGAPIAVTYVYITTANGCNNAPGQNVVVTVEPVPVVNDPADQVLCTGAATVAVNFTGTATSYSWVNDTPSIGLAASGTGNIASFTAINSGTAPVVATITITPSYNACVGATENFTITVNPTPTLSSTLTPAAICSGTTFSYTPTSATVGATFAWSRALLAGIAEAANAGAGNISEVLTNTTTTPINVTYVVTTTANGCSNAGQNVVVTVNPTPVLSSTLSPANICSGTVFNYTATSATVGATFAWSRALIAGITEGASAGAGNVSETLTNTTGAPIAVTYVYITTANGCNNAPGQNVVVTVEPVPVVNDPADQVLCTGAATVAVNFTGTATSYSWVNDTPSIGLAASGTGNIASFTAINSGTAPVVATITITPSYNACVGATENFTITVNPTPTLSSTLTPAAICSGTTFSYTPTSATVGATFAWSRALLAGIAEAANAGAGNISEVLTNTTTTPINVTYVVTTTANGCSNAGQNVVVTVNPTPVLSSTLSPANICSGTVFNYTATSATVGATFAWSRALIAGITEGASAGAGNVSETLTNTTGAPIAVTYVYITTANGCNNAPGQNVVVTVEPVPVVNDPADQVLCTGAATVAVNFTGTATSYSWVNDTPSIGLAASGTGNIASFTAINSGTAPVVATITITPSYNACVGATENFTITVNPTPTLSSTLTPAAICSGTTFSYTPTSATVGATFAWSRALLAGIAEAANAGAGNISEVLTNTTTTPINVTYVVTTTANGCSNAGQNVVVTVNPTPVLSSTLSPANICSGTVFNYTATSATVGATFAWSRALIAGITEGASAGAGNVSETLTNTTGAPIAVTYVYITTANGCNNAPGQNVVVTVEPVPVVNDPADQVLCTGAATVAVNFTGTATSYSWVNDTPSIGLAASGTGNIASFTAINSGTAPVVATITITPSYNACVGATENFTITVNPTPTLSSTLTPAAICSGTTFSYTPTSATVGATFAWSRALLAGIAEAANAGAGNISEVLTNTTTTPINVTYVVTTTANGCSNAGQNVVVTVNPTPVLSSTLSPANICSGTVFNYTATSATVGATFAWSRALIAGITEGASAGAGNVSETLTNTTGAPIAVTYVYITTANGCNNAPGQNVVVTVEPVPVVNDPADQVLCTGAATVAVNFTGTATSYSWVNDTPSIGLAASGTGNIASFTAINSGTAPVVATITITPSYNACVGATENFTITVNPTPKITNTPLLVTICSDAGPLSFTPTIDVPGSTYQWTSSISGPVNFGSVTAGPSSSPITDNPINTGAVNGTVTYTITPTGPGGTFCVGPSVNYVVTVQPEPAGVPVTVVRCSDVALGAAFTLNTNGTSVTAASYTIATNPNGLTQSAGTVSAGAGKLANELIDDAWTNQTGGQVSVIYTVTPLSSAGCSGQPFNVTVNVDPEPATTAPVVTAAVCSDVGTGYNLTVAGASSYTIATNSNGLVQSAGTVSAGSGKLANELSADAWTNTTAGVVNVVYTITPVSGTCNGDVFTVTVPITPEPRGANSTESVVCSDVPFSFNPQTRISNGIASTFTWTVTYDAGISGGAGFGSGNVAETLNNVSGGTLNAIYTVIPRGPGPGNCFGDAYIMTVPVRSEPLGVDDSKTVCSDVSIDYNLLLNVASFGNNIGSTFSWVAADNVNPLVTGESLTPVIGPIITDVITNLTNTDQPVVYTVTPTATSGCVGNSFDITVTIKPEPVGVTSVAPDICSGVTVGYDLQINVNTLGNLLPANFTWTAASNANITGETTSLKSGPIIDDVLVNTTTSNQTVVYTVTPTSQAGGCVGNAFTISVTVNPKAIFSAGPDLAVCVADASKLLSGTSTFAPGGLLWTGGSNSFSNNAIPNPTYTLSAAELAVTSPTLVTLTLRAFGTGACPDLTDQMVLTINPQPIVTYTGFPAGAPPQMAENNAPITLTGNQVGGVFTISPVTSNIGSTSPSPVDKASFDPSAVDLGSNFVTYTYTDPNGCTNFNTQEVIVNPVTNVDFTMQYTIGSAPFPFVPINAVGQFEVCAEVGLVKLVGNPAASTGLPPETQFTSIPAYGGGPTATITFDGINYFMQTNGLASDTYRVLYTYKNAFNAITTRIRDVIVFASPVAAFNSTGSCFGGASIFTDMSTINPTPFATTITSLSWDFGDLALLSGPPGGSVPLGTHSGNTSGTYSMPNHIYLSPSSYNASLRVTTAQGCSNTIITPTPIIVGSIPISDFVFSSICNNDSTKFSSIITNLGASTVSSYNWDFGDGATLSGNGTIPLGTHGGSTSGTFAQPLHNYSSFGSYNVTLTVNTNFNCISPVKSRPVKIASFVTVTPTPSDPPFDFENGRQSWFIEDLISPDDSAFVSWNWGLPTGVTINTAVNGNNVWWTQKNGNTYFNNEKSAVNGPCFNLTLLSRPMVSLDYWSDMENNVDGAVLQYSTDGGLNWNIVGPPVGLINRDEGINWFNGVTIPSNPGNQPLGSYGWTGTDKAAGWKNGRFNLDMVPIAERDQVRLRIAFSSNDLNPTGDTFDGFAFDNVFVGDKKRNVLVEHFTNSNNPSNPAIQISNDYLDNLSTLQFGTDFSDLRYHISSAIPDPINLENPTDPGARGSYYNVSQAPSTIMDGKLDGVNFTGSFLDINSIEIDRRALVDPLFNLVLDTLASNNNNTITARLGVTATQAFTAPLIAQVVLVERVVGTAKNVVRKQLFGADGFTISTPWTLGQQIFQTNANVAINVPIVNSNQLELVGYIQDKNTKEIYQSIVISAPVKRGTVVVGLEDEPLDQISTQITMYPNPAKGEVYFGLPSTNMSGYAWKIADQRGVIMSSGDFDNQIDGELPVDISNLANGVYHVIISKGKSATYKKLVVMNRN